MVPCYQRCLLPASLGFAFTSCGSPDAPVSIESDAPIHLEDHLSSALVDSTPPPTVLEGQRDWTFEEDDASWKPLSVPAPPKNGARSRGATVPSCTLAHEDGALRVSLREASRFDNVLIGGVYTELDEESPDLWGTVVLRVRLADRIRGAMVLLELEDGLIPESAISSMMVSSEIAPAFSDGTLLTYAFPVRPLEGLDQDERSTRLGIAFAVPRASRIDVVSVTGIPAAEQLTWAATMSLRRARHGDWTPCERGGSAIRPPHDTCGRPFGLAAVLFGRAPPVALRSGGGPVRGT